MGQDLLGLGENLGFHPEERENPGELWAEEGWGLRCSHALAAVGELSGYGQRQDLTQALTCALWWIP